MRNVTYINAGAGSGKTYTLTKILAEKLSKKEVKPSEVIHYDLYGIGSSRVQGRRHVSRFCLLTIWKLLHRWTVLL